METNESKKTNRGGARAGAGRKRIEGRNIAATFRISQLAKDNLARYADAHGISAQEALNRLLEALTS